MYSEGALQRFCDQTDYIQDCFDYAALNLEVIAVGHPFVEGNKRTAFVMAMLVLSKNDHHVPDSQETVDFVRETAMGLYSREKIAEWLRNHAVRCPSASRGHMDSV